MRDASDVLLFVGLAFVLLGLALSLYAAVESVDRDDGRHVSPPSAVERVAKPDTLYCSETDLAERGLICTSELPTSWKAEGGADR